ncbi:hypothetical protein SCLCIDRAFT_27431 [Scleroderma citrinum Foug A]|uniref:DUF6534 domain-containing protein n=1 Tax=Scleroderma citrinum Foug A TaxID=1036808 RepID=A0A0C3DSZ8_9AGAM|nr:hypothetical protein SCLCIDRAFT_27431 [Scleroderma citrinum Foug A]
MHQALITHSAYVYLVTDIAAPTRLGNLVWSLVVEVLFNAITAFLVQYFLTMRVYRLSNRNIIATASVLVVVTAQFVLSVAYVAKAIPLKTFVDVEKLKILSSAINAVTVVSDVMIAACLCFLLQKARTGFRRFDNMINKLILFSINTGLLTSLFAIASHLSKRPVSLNNVRLCIINRSLSGPMLSFTSRFISAWVAVMYCNSLLATLNARRIIQENMSDVMSMSLQGATKKTTTQSVIGTTQWTSICDEPDFFFPFLTKHLYQPMANNISIRIDTTQELVRDGIRDQYSASRTEMKLPV